MRSKFVVAFARLEDRQFTVIPCDTLSARIRAIRFAMRGGADCIEVIEF